MSEHPCLTSQGSEYRAFFVGFLVSSSLSIFLVEGPTSNHQLKAFILAGWDHTQVLRDSGIAPSVQSTGFLKAKSTSWDLAQKIQGSFAEASILTEAKISG